MGYKFQRMQHDTNISATRKIFDILKCHPQMHQCWSSDRTKLDGMIVRRVTTCPRWWDAPSESKMRCCCSIDYTSVCALQSGVQLVKSTNPLKKYKARCDRE